MMRFRKHLICFCVLLVTCTGTALGQKGANHLSLEKALAIAYQNNPQMVEARKDIEIQKGKSFRETMLDNPEAELSYGGFKKNEEGKRKTNLDAFVLKQPFGPLGTKWIDGQIASKEIAIAHQKLAQTWAHVRTKVIRLYSQILTAERVIEISRINLDATRQFFTLVENRFHSGEALRSELTRARIEVFQAENDILIEQKNLDVSKSQLNLALGKDLNTSFDFEDITNDHEWNQPYENLLEKALEHRADLKIAEKEYEIAGQKKTHSYFETIFPDLTIGFERTMENFENDSSIILEFSYPLWGLNWGKMKEAKAEKEKQKIHLDTVKKQVGLDVYQAFAEAELADQQMNIQRRALEQANELLQQTTLDYQEGEIPFVIFLENLKTVKQTRLAYWEAVSQYQEKIAELQMAVGDVPEPEDMK